VTDAFSESEDVRSRRIGIITGSGPDAGVDLWTKLLAASRERFGEDYNGDLDAPDVEIYSRPILGLSMDLPDNCEKVWEDLASVISDVAQRVGILCIACYTLHAFADRIRAMNLPCEFVSLVDVVSDFVRSRCLSEVAILDARSSREATSPLTDVLAPVTLVHSYHDIPKLRQLILAIKKMGGKVPSFSRDLAAVVQEFECSTVILACTELSLLNVDVSGKQVVDGVRLLADRLVGLSQRGGIL
jgi:aspartate racemase